MAKRMSKAESTLLGWSLIIGLPIFLIAQLVESIGWIIPLGVAIGSIGLMMWHQKGKGKKRLAYLRDKYNDEDIVQRIVQGYLWLGQTEEQLQDAIGAPVSIDRAVLKTKTKETWKYHRQGANRFGLRITVENGHVIGWDKKA